MAYRILHSNNFLYGKYKKYRDLKDNEKIVHRFVAKTLKKFDIFFVIIPVVFVICNYIIKEPNSFPELTTFVTQLTQMMWISSIYDYYAQNSTISTFISFFLFFTSRVYSSNVQVYENETVYSETHHSLSHNYRDFIDEVIVLKKKHNLFDKGNFNSKRGKLKEKYINFIGRQCETLLNSLNNLIKDNGYICIKLLEKDENDDIIIKEVSCFSNNSKRKKKDSFTNVKINIDILDEQPNNLFEEIIKELNKLQYEQEKEKQIDGLGKVYNYLPGESSYNNDSCNYKFKNYKSSLISPIIYDYGLVGFLCYNSTKAWSLRKKHLELLCAVADNIANLQRSHKYLSNID